MKLKQVVRLGGGSFAVLFTVFSSVGCGSSGGSGSPEGAAGSASSSGGSSSGGSASSSAGSSSSAAGVGASGSGGLAAVGGGSGAGSPPPAKGVGTACATDADCTSPLACRFDTTDYTADMQCTMPCEADATCTGALGKDSFCIGANICVHGCTSDADCSAKTHCNVAGWCERSGPGSGVPYCTGTPTPCVGQTDAACILSSGCMDNAKCTGVAGECFAQFDDLSCTSVQGCYWDSVGMDCTGVAQSCDEQPGSLSCASQQGCTWSGGCTGIPDACDTQFPSLCTEQPGCVLKTD